VGSDLARWICHPAGVEVWVYEGVTYQVDSMYLVPQDEWTYELTTPCCTSGTVAGLAVVIPDATPNELVRTSSSLVDGP
jgi:hypothetical protein